MKFLLIVPLLLAVAFCVQAQQTKQPPKEPVAPYTIPEEAVHQANPVKATPESIAHGKKWYGYDCAMCHGKDGDGKGEVGADMKLKVSDFTDPATLKERTDGELFYIIKFGKGDMPPEGARVKTDKFHRATSWNSCYDYHRPSTCSSSDSAIFAPSSPRRRIADTAC